jgi:hypothetical protein
MPVGANLLHHAVEMYLKGALSPSLTLGELKSSFDHNLSKTWEKFKTTFNDARLDAFDAAIKELHRWERLRYPDAILKEGMVAQFVVFRRDAPAAVGGSSPFPTYVLVLEDIDELVGILFEKAKVNPEFHVGRLSADAKEFLLRHNEHPLKT